MAKQKYYVVWVGKTPGIYTSWDQCKAQVEGFTGAKYKSFSSRQEAEQALQSGWKEYYQTSSSKGAGSNKSKSVKVGTYIEDSLSVDAACSGNPGLMEYQGVDTKTGEQLFHYGPVDHGTNNIGEFLAIVHGLAYLKQKGSSMPIYSDSQTAIGWVKKKKPNTTIDRNSQTEKLWSLIDRATHWLNQNTYSNPLLKWETEQWGEIKADFGRK